jgi:nucleotide-binding universal stress UspA family protein
MGNIVVGYDGSAESKLALDRAASLANGRSVTVVSVVDIEPGVAVHGAIAIDPDEVTERENQLGEAVALLKGKGVVAKAIEGRGAPAAAICQAAKDSGADMIIVGTRGRGMAARALLGSVSTSVVHDAHCDVLVVR